MIKSIPLAAKRPNRPLERAGMKRRGDGNPRRAGRSAAPIRLGRHTW
jgi:hypothetical protein